MVESVRQYGVLVPGICRARTEGGFEIIAGHTRYYEDDFKNLTTEYTCEAAYKLTAENLEEFQKVSYEVYRCLPLYQKHRLFSLCKICYYIFSVMRKVVLYGGENTRENFICLR